MSDRPNPAELLRDSEDVLVCDVGREDVSITLSIKAELVALVEAAQLVAHEIETDLPRKCLMCFQPGDEHVEDCIAPVFLAALENLAGRLAQ